MTCSRTLGVSVPMPTMPVESAVIVPAPTRKSWLPVVRAATPAEGKLAQELVRSAPPTTALPSTSRFGLAEVS